MISGQPQGELGSRRRTGGTPNGASPGSVPPGIQTASWEDVSLADIDTSDLAFQYRFPSEVASIRQSLQAEGQREPIDLVGKRPFQVVDGFRRIMAASELGWTKVKAFVHGELPADEAYRIAFTKNVVRRNLRPLERAQAMIVALKKRGLTEAQLRTAFGISEKQVKRYLGLLEFPEPIQKILDGEVVTMAHAKALADFGVGDDAPQWKQRIEAERLTARALVRILTSSKGRKPAGRPKLYMRRNGSRIRMYAFTIGKDAPRDDRERVVRLLQEAIDLLK
jgi:ParB/RepB/Spo0J family partition protein